jgi:predicted  nucleic acid-binding Zn-ribbon protein
MSENTSGASGAPKYITTMIFWVVTAVLVVAVGVVYFVMNNEVAAAKKDAASALESAIKKQNEQTDDKLAKLTSAFDAKVADLTKENDALKKANDILAKNLGDVTTQFTKFVDTEYKALKAKLSDDLSGAKSDIIKTNENLNKVDTRVGYVEKSLKDLTERVTAIGKDVSSLNVSSAELKKEQVELQKELSDFSSRGKVTENDLRTLEVKTRMFELKVMRERAAQASEALRNNDMRSVFEQIKFKDGEK